MEADSVIHLNGSPHPLASGNTVLTLLQSLGLDGIPVLVEHNTTALFPREFPDTPLKAGDQVEIIRIVAGG
jgi:sulfur carrier protein